MSKHQKVQGWERKSQKVRSTWHLVAWHLVYSEERGDKKGQTDVYVRLDTEEGGSALY